MSIQNLREQRNDLAKQAKNQLSEKGDQKWTPEDKDKFDEYADQIDALDSRISTTQKVLDLAAEERFDDVKLIDPKDKEAVSARNLFAKMLRNGAGALTAEEHLKVRNVLSTTTGSQGGFSVQTDVAKELIDLMAGYRGVREVATRLVTSTGAPLGYPSSDGTAETGELVAENATAAALDPVFGTVPLNTFKFSSKSIGVPIELLQDASIDIVAMVNKRSADRIGRIQNTLFTTGTGTGQPFGIATAATIGKTGIVGQTLTVIYDDLVDLTDSIDYAYDNGGLTFMLSQTTRKVVRKIKDSSGRPIWTPSYDIGIIGKTPDQLLGYNVNLNNAMAAPAANALSIAFGDMSRYMVRDAMELTMFRFEDSAYLSKGQIGFLAWSRSGGNLLDTTAVKTYKHSAT